MMTMMERLGGRQENSRFFVGDTLDDLMRALLATLVDDDERIEATKGRFSELFGCCLHLRNPRARLSRSEGKGKVFSALGELLWYLSGDTRLDFIEYYIPGQFEKESDDGVRVRSGYGERLMSYRGINQVQNVIELLRSKPTSRRAVIQLFDASDLSRHYRSIPCTCTLQFLVREERLHLFVSMRSNDAYIGLPHDVFSFTMIQELVARSIDAEVGEYRHCAGSLHLYEKDRASAAAYLDEGWQSSIAMPPMPEGDPWADICRLKRFEETVRLKGGVNIIEAPVPDYWRDLSRLLVAYRAYRDRSVEELRGLMNMMSSDVYKMFIQGRIDRLLEQARANSDGEPQ